MATRIPRPELLRHACDIAQEYGGNLTLRQLYYQLVARALSPNGQKDYNRLKDLLIEARVAGTFRFDWLIDRSRTVHRGDYTDRSADVDGALEAAAESVGYMPYWHLKADRWWGQRTHVSVWVEKEALSGVFEKPCNDLGVSWFACKGYPSLSSLYDWVLGVEAAVDESAHVEWGDNPADFGIDNVVVIYFGDHDPDGFQIPRSAMTRIDEIQAATGIYLPPVTLDRVALNMDQIEAYGPPPFAAKMTSPRYEGYRAEHRTDLAWELDALRPDQLQKLITDGVGAHFDPDIYDEVQSVIRAKRTKMREGMRRDGWLTSALDKI